MSKPTVYDEAVRAADPNRLPAEPSAFTGRRNELDQLIEFVVRPACDDPMPRIAIISGMGGVGKSALAITWANRNRHLFPDGHYFFNLRGYDQRDSVDPFDLIADLLRILGVPPDAVPVTLSAREALLREVTADRRQLFVFDNVSNSDQIRPLLPSSPTCFVLVTSRSKLPGLVATETAFRLVLRELSEADGLDLLSKLLGRSRVSAELPTAHALVSFCYHLPLIIRVAIERISRWPNAPLAEVLADLDFTRSRLKSFDIETKGEGLALRTVLSWFLPNLSELASRLFRLTALMPGADFGVDAAAALAACSQHEAKRSLEALVDLSLLQEFRPGRYSFHDLIREYASECLAELESDFQQDLARNRIVVWYLHVASIAARALAPNTRRFPLPPLPAGCSIPSRELDYPQALRWFENERANLLAITKLAAREGLFEVSWKLPAVCQDNYYNLGKLFDDWIATHEIALRAAQAMHDPFAEAWIRNLLGLAYWHQRRRSEAVEVYERALQLWRALDDKIGISQVLNNLGAVHRSMGQHRLAYRYTSEAVEVARDAGYLWGEGWALDNLGEILRDENSHLLAIPKLREAIDRKLRSGDRYGEIYSLGHLADSLRRVGESADALRYFGAALSLAVDLNDPHGESWTLHHWGETLLAQGDAKT